MLKGSATPGSLIVVYKDGLSLVEVGSTDTVNGLGQEIWQIFIEGGVSGNQTTCGPTMSYLINPGRDDRFKVTNIPGTRIKPFPSAHASSDEQSRSSTEGPTIDRIHGLRSAVGRASQQREYSVC